MMEASPSPPLRDSGAATGARLYRILWLVWHRSGGKEEMDKKLNCGKSQSRFMGRYL
jgi:hypothetical protein